MNPTPTAPRPGIDVSKDRLDVFVVPEGEAFAVAMVGLAAAAILYTTSNILRYYRTDHYVAAALSLFAAVALMFYYVLWILLCLRRE